MFLSGFSVLESDNSCFAVSCKQFLWKSSTSLVELILVKSKIGCLKNGVWKSSLARRFLQVFCEILQVERFDYHSGLQAHDE
jgi:hypothetical protein